MRALAILTALLGLTVLFSGLFEGEGDAGDQRGALVGSDTEGPEPVVVRRLPRPHDGEAPADAKGETTGPPVSETCETNAIPEGSIEIVVIRHDGGRAGGATVHWGIFNERGHGSVTADGTGRCLIERVERRGTPQVVHAIKAGFGPSCRVLVRADDRRIALVLAPRCSVKGVVVDAEDRPVAGAYLYMPLRAPWWSPEGSRETTSDADGRFEFAAIPMGRWTVEVTTDERHVETRTFARPGAEVVRIRIPGLVRLSGRVIDEAGLPISGAAVSASPDDGAPLAGGMASLDEYSNVDGSFEFAVDAARAYRVSARADGRLRASAVVDLRGRREAAIELALRDSGTITGRVVDTHGNTRRLPVYADAEGPGGSFRLGAARVVCADDGTFVLGPLDPRSTYRVRISADGRCVRVDHAIVCGQDLHALIDLANPLTVGIRCRIRPTADHRRRRYTVSCEPVGTNPWPRVSRQDSDECELEGLFPGQEYELLVTAGGLLRQSFGTFAAEAGRTFDLELKPLVGVDVEISGVDGRPLEGATVTLRRGGDAEMQIPDTYPVIVTDRRGRVHMRRLEPGDWSITARWGGRLGRGLRRIEDSGTIRLVVR